MALLEALPEEVENSLRDLRALAAALPPAAKFSDSKTANGNNANGKIENGNGSSSDGSVDSSHAVIVVTSSKESAGDNGIRHTNGAGHNGLADGSSDNKTADIVKITGESASETISETTEASADETPKRIAFETDINAAGVFGREWLVVEDEQVYVFSPNGGTRAHLRHSIPLIKIQEAKTETFIGNGQLNVRTDEETVPLVRFSQAHIGEANMVARQLNALAKGETPKTESVEEKRKNCPKCGRVLPEDSEVCPACINKRAVMLRLFQFLAPYKPQMWASIILLILSSAADLAPPFIGGRIIDTLITHPDPITKMPVPIVPAIAMHSLFVLVGILAISKVFVAGVTYGQRRLNPWLGGRITMDIRMRLYHKFNQLSLAYYDKRSTGSMMSRVTNDADNLWDFIAEGLPWLVSNTLTLFGIGFVLFHLNWQLALLTLTPGPLIFLLTRWFMPRARTKWHSVWHRISKMYSSLNSTLTGMRVVKAFAQEGREVDNFQNRNTSVFLASYAANSFWAVYWPILGLLMSLGLYIIYLFGGYKVATGAMTAGTLTMFIGYLGQFYAPFQNFSRVVDWSTRSMTAAERVFEILDTEPDIRDAEKAVPMPTIKGAIEFKDVSFTYDKAKRVLEDFSLKVEPGEMIGLVGHSGAGKSTIINLLSRFYDVTEGSILIDGVNIKEIQREDFRGQLGIVLQEPFLFPGTILSNIAYAKPTATVDEVMRAAKAANCHEFIMKFPDGYDTQVGERGQRLSGGERQRISIARAILHDPRILILDEATASVDTETEKQIQEAITRLVKNRTTFAIAHRLSTLRNASRLVVMKDGKMAETGTHEELMEQDGVYANLVKIQTEVNKMKAV